MWIGPSVYNETTGEEKVTRKPLKIGDVVHVPLKSPGGIVRDRATVFRIISEWEADAENEHAEYHLHYDNTPDWYGVQHPSWHCDGGWHKGSGLPLLGPG